MSFAGIILSIVILSILVIVHEFGHYILAKKNGILVKEFSIGFGPRIISVGKGETKFSWKAIPFGGSCTMLGALEDQDEEGEYDEERSFEKKSVWARISVVLAGPFFNFFLAFILAVIMIGTMGYDPPTITNVEPGSAAYEAGLREGDLITKYDGKGVSFGRELYLENYIHPVKSSDSIDVEYQRDGQTYSTSLIPKESETYMIGISYIADGKEAEITDLADGSAAKEAGLRTGDVITAINGVAISSGEELNSYFDEHVVTAEDISIEFSRHGIDKSTVITPTVLSTYKLGFSYNMQNVKTNAGGTLKYSFAELGYQVSSVFKALGILFSGQGSLDMLSGPVGIVQIVGETYDASVPSGFVVTLMNLFSLMILLSVNLGVLNLLPLPALDGGKFILLVIEAIRKKPLNRKYEGIVTVVFAVLLMILAVVVLVNDITKFF